MSHPSANHHLADQPAPTGAAKTHREPQAASAHDPLTTPGRQATQAPPVRHNSDLDSWVEVLKELNRQATR